MEKKLPIVYIEWDDSESTYGWREAETEKPKAIKSCGILVDKNKNGVSISTSKTDYNKYVDQMWIPASAIRKYKKVKI